MAMTLNEPEFSTVKPMDCGRFRVLSLGTGTSMESHSFSAASVSEWGALSWLYNGETSPLVEVFSQGSADVVDIHVSTVFRAIRSQDNYLRIQVIDYLFL
jgi:hypothetical protein